MINEAKRGMKNWFALARYLLKELQTDKQTNFLAQLKGFCFAIERNLKDWNKREIKVLIKKYQIECNFSFMNQFNLKKIQTSLKYLKILST